MSVVCVLSRTVRILPHQENFPVNVDFNNVVRIDIFNLLKQILCIGAHYHLLTCVRDILLPRMC